MVEIFKYMDRIFAMIRPRRLLFLAIDGVAPRAKMNQQRSRRFRAAKERREKAEKAAQLKQEAALGVVMEEEDEDGTETGGENFDFNCITPGTKFMALIASSIRYYIVERMNRDHAWKSLKVIFSDASVPGEGEHKIVDYIRRQRLDPDYDPNTKHVIYGLDADLIMLSMATHEPYFRVLREDVFWEEQIKYSPCSFCGIKGHVADRCPERVKSDPSFSMKPLADKPFIFLDVAVLREYLEAELRPNFPISFKWNLERAIDDWIFMCFFIGNDFLPHLPSLEIREGAVDILIDIYKKNMAKMGGFICHNGLVDLKRAQFILNDLGLVEERIFQKRREKEERRNENIRKRKVGEFERGMSRSNEGGEEESLKNLEAAKAFRAKMEADDADQKAFEASDQVRFWEKGSKARYYLNKFHVDISTSDQIVRDLVKSYIEGLCWVMAYYYQGCPSWKWFYPYHYAPFASDLVNVSDLDVRFELGEPFRPFDQLMGVFPADSKDLVPEPFRRIMTDVDSEVIDFYPTDFAVDLNGKRQAWQGVVLLPFIEESRLLAALDKVYPELDSADVAMNRRGEDQVFFSIFHPATRKYLHRLDDRSHSLPLDPQETEGLAGYIKMDGEFPQLGENYESPLPNEGCPDVEDITVCRFIYMFPYHERKKLTHKAILLPYAVPPPRVLGLEDIEAVQNGTATRRVPGRLQIDLGRHSMHQEYSQEYGRRDAGETDRNHRRDYPRDEAPRGYARGRDPGHGREGGHGPPPFRYPPPALPPRGSAPQYPPPVPADHGPYLPPQDVRSYNPYETLASAPPPRSGPMQPAMSLFHRGPPPGYQASQDEGRPVRRRLDDLYGRYPPPSSKQP